jgi:RimJ/RimL family protein N-acetyltransferase
VVELELFDERHLPDMAAVLDDADVLRFTRVPVPVPPDFARTWYDRYVEGRRTASREIFAAVDAHTREFVGLAMAPHIDVETATMELGYLVAPAARGRGLGTEILRLVTDWAFATHHPKRIELLISTANPASQRVAQRCGYVREGVLRSLYFKQGEREDTEMWSLLPSDPR